MTYIFTWQAQHLWGTRDWEKDSSRTSHEPKKNTRWGKIEGESLCQLTLDSWRVFLFDAGEDQHNDKQSDVSVAVGCQQNLLFLFLLFMVRTFSSSESEGFVQLSMVSSVKKEWMIFCGNIITSTQVHSVPFLRQWSSCSIWLVQIDDIHLHKKWKYACQLEGFKFRPSTIICELLNVSRCTDKLQVPLAIHLDLMLSGSGVKVCLGGGFKYFSCSPLLGEDSQFD